MKHVLLVCTHSAGRSQMARAFFEPHQRPPSVMCPDHGKARECLRAARCDVPAVS